MVVVSADGSSFSRMWKVFWLVVGVAEMVMVAVWMGRWVCHSPPMSL